MNDLVDIEEVERRLRRTLASRADDMAPGDRLATGPQAREGREAAVIPLHPPFDGSKHAPLLPIGRDGPGERDPGPGSGDPGGRPPSGTPAAHHEAAHHDKAGARRSRRLWFAVAAAAAVIVGEVGVLVATRGEDDAVRTADSATTATDGTAPGDDPDAPPTTPPGGETGAPTTEPGDAPSYDGEVPVPHDVIVAFGGYAIGTYEDADHTWMMVEFDLPDETAHPIPETAETVTVGDRQARFVAAGPLTSSQLWLPVEGGTVYMEAGDTSREVVLAAAASVSFDEATGLYTMPAPPGWRTEFTMSPDIFVEDGDDAGSSEFIATAEAADGRSYTVQWYAGWDRDDVDPVEAEPITVPEGEGIVGTLVPGLDMYIAWVFYDDGYIEIQCNRGMTRQDAAAAAQGVARAPGTGDFTVSPLPGFTAQE